jgi:parvulin-like peptidyl-prolyl isomerase
LRPLRNWGIVAALVGALALVGVGSSAIGAVLLAPEELPANVVAFVAYVPVRTGRVTGAEFQRALAQQAASAGLASAPKPGEKRYADLRDHAVGELLDAAWIKGQALEMGIAVTRRQVTTELAGIKKANFKDKADYHAFLKQSHFTQADVNERVELQMLSTRIQERVARGVRGERQIQAKFKKFVDAYQKRWRARTVCAAEFVIDRCSNGPPSA